MHVPRCRCMEPGNLPEREKQEPVAAKGFPRASKPPKEKAEHLGFGSSAVKEIKAILEAKQASVPGPET